MNTYKAQTDYCAKAAGEITPQTFDRVGLEASLLAFAQFGAGAVHDVNGPLAVSLLSAQLALRTLPADSDAALRLALERTIDGIRTAASAVREVVHKCSDRIASKQRFDVRDVLRFTTTVVQEETITRGCTLQWRLSHDESPITGNPVELQIALTSCLIGIASSGAKAVVISSRASSKWVTIQIDVVGLYACDDDPCGLELLSDFAARHNGAVSNCPDETSRQIIISLPRLDK